MNIETKGTAWKDVLFQSDLYGEKYKALLDETDSSAPILFSYQDIQDVYNTIILNATLTDFQQAALQNLFVVFNDIRSLIDPERLKSFDYSITEDKELLIYRKSSAGLTNIIIHDEECIAYSFIPYDPSRKPTLQFVENTAELEQLAYLFFSN
ncbi:MAG TPA: hypothetical protein PKZ75_06825 [Bacteroidia bacterium]|nr:hypothetical protein [Bacteroidia bacterium]